MIPGKYRAFCKNSGIPLPNSPGFYLMLHELPKGKSGDLKWESDAYSRLVERIDELQDFIDQQWQYKLKTPGAFARIYNANRLFLEHAQQLETLGYPVIDEDTLREKRRECAMLIRMDECPVTWELIQTLSRSKLPEFAKGSILGSLSGIVTNEARRLKLEDAWISADREASVALEARPWKYPA